MKQACDGVACLWLGRRLWIFRLPVFGFFMIYSFFYSLYELIWQTVSLCRKASVVIPLGDACPSGVIWLVQLVADARG